jgi:hypothetical protein
MNEIKMYHRGLEIFITQVIGKNVKIKRVDGGGWFMSSTLRHHYGTSTRQVGEITVSMDRITRQA